MKYISVPIPITCPEPRIREARNLLFKADVQSKVVGCWPTLKLNVYIEEDDKSDDLSYIFSLGMLVGQFVH